MAPDSRVASTTNEPSAGVVGTTIGGLLLLVAGRVKGGDRVVGFVVGVAVGIVHRQLIRAAADVEDADRAGSAAPLVPTLALTPIVVAVDRAVDGLAGRASFCSGVAVGSAIRGWIE